jgi:hypothetical protein
MRIGICILATNAYFVLGLRFIKRFLYFYKGNYRVSFYFFSDTDPRAFLPEGAPVKFIPTQNNSWVDGTNLKFSSILSIQDDLIASTDLAYYFDADTNIDKAFTEEWFIGTAVGGEHYGNRTHMTREGRPYDRNPLSKAYIPHDTPLEQTYYYGAFFGGTSEWLVQFSETLLANQLKDKEINYEPAVNDESYINNYFHYNPPTRTVPSDKFQFLISDKGGLGETRNTSLDISSLKRTLLQHRDTLFDIQHGKILLNQ